MRLLDIRMGVNQILVEEPVLTRALEIANLAIRCCVVLLLLTTALLFIQLRKSAIIVHEQVEGIAQDAHTLTSAAGGIAKHADGVLSKAEDLIRNADTTQREQSQYFQALDARVKRVILPQIEQTLSHFDALIADTNDSLNSEVLGVLPAVARDAEDLGARTREAKAVLEETAAAMRGIDRLANDPNIQRTLANLEAMSESGTETMGHVNAATGDIKDAVHRATRPTALWKSLLMKALGVGANARTVVLGR